uniref:Putative secreted protein n=1 Tax=Anopheles darlingi TaxID=43151 RepID=A0A2M4DDW6_ANODA
MALTLVSLLTSLVNMVSCSSSKFRANSVSTVGEWRWRFMLVCFVLYLSLSWNRLRCGLGCCFRSRSCSY